MSLRVRFAKSDGGVIVVKFDLNVPDEAQQAAPHAEVMYQVQTPGPAVLPSAHSEAVASSSIAMASGLSNTIFW
jgi:hypothetical protein